jgi:hypothetical protein
MRGTILFFVSVFLVAPVSAQSQFDTRARVGVTIVGMSIEGYGRGGYGLFGGGEIVRGRLRLRPEGYLVISDTPTGEARRELGLCPDEPTGSCTELLGWASGDAVYDVYAQETRVYLGGGVYGGAGAQTGSFGGFHGVGGVTFSRNWGLELKIGPAQLVLSAFIRF